MRRPRGPGGRFLTADELKAMRGPDDGDAATLDGDGPASAMPQEPDVGDRSSDSDSPELPLQPGIRGRGVELDAAWPGSI